jgi:outer membrane protein OmpA-like peptidoglycan-associated protein
MEKLPEAPPAKAVAAAPQNILPDVPPVPAAVTKNTGALYVIPFAADSDEIKLEEQGYLLALVQRLKQEENLRIAVQGFAPLNNGQEYEARRLSLKRAVGVRQLLMDKGVDATRVNVQALGSATEESLKDRVDILRIN